MNINAVLSNTKEKFNKRFVKKLVILSNNLPYKRFECNICDSKFNHYLPMPKHFEDMKKKAGFPFSYDDFETLNYKRNMCPVCKTGDVNRLIYLYLSKYVLNNKNTYSVLDIAPVKIIKDKLKSESQVKKYRSADLYSELADDNIDITDMKIYKKNTYDLIICSHVLEHVEKDNIALNEIYRVLKPKGTAILMVPINLKVNKSIEGIPTNSEIERWKLYGQGDHVRQYSKNDFKNRIKSAGFKLKQITMSDFSEKEFFIHGISKKSVLYVARKQK